MYAPTFVVRRETCAAYCCVSAALKVDLRRVPSRSALLSLQTLPHKAGVAAKDRLAAPDRDAIAVDDHAAQDALV
jgi:hypothetical protein